MFGQAKFVTSGLTIFRCSRWSRCLRNRFWGRTEQLRAASRVIPAAAPIEAPPIVPGAGNDLAATGRFRRRRLVCPPIPSASPTARRRPTLRQAEHFRRQRRRIRRRQDKSSLPISSLPPTGAVPNYGPPGGFVPSNTTPSYPGAPPRSIEQPLPPDWRPLSGQLPNQGSTLRLSKLDLGCRICRQ